MCIQDIKIAKSQETRATSVNCPSGATTQIAGLANNRVRVRFAPTSITGAIGNLNVVIQYVGDSAAIGIGFISAGVPYVELTLEDNSHFVKGPFQAANSSGVAVPIGVAEVLQNTDPEDAI